MMVLYGQSSGRVGPFDPQVLSQKGSLFLTRPTLAHYIATRAELLARAGEVLGWIKSRKLTVRIERELPLARSEEHTSELQSRPHLVCRLLLEKKKNANDKRRDMSTILHQLA